MLIFQNSKVPKIWDISQAFGYGIFNLYLAEDLLSHVNSTVNFLRSCQTAFYRACVLSCSLGFLPGQPSVFFLFFLNDSPVLVGVT
jgi:hypothetical protein